MAAVVQWFRLDASVLQAASCRVAEMWCTVTRVTFDTILVVKVMTLETVVRVVTVVTVVTVVSVMTQILVSTTKKYHQKTCFYNKKSQQKIH